MIKSPCKECPKHKTKFPFCMPTCKIINEIQLTDKFKNNLSDIEYDDHTKFIVNI